VLLLENSNGETEENLNKLMPGYRVLNPYHHFWKPSEITYFQLTEPSLIYNGYPAVFYLELKRPGREADHSLPSGAKVELYLHSPIHIHGVVLGSAQGQLYLYFTILFFVYSLNFNFFLSTSMYDVLCLL
jgi:hypothetical protein